MQALELLKSLSPALVTTADLDSSQPYITTAFQYGNGDMVTLFPERAGDAWVLHDAGFTVSLLTASGRELTDARLSALTELCASYEVEFASRRFEISIEEAALESRFRDLVQAIIRADMLRFEAHRQRQNPLEVAFERFLSLNRELSRNVKRNWTDQETDPEGLYPVDYHLNTMVSPRNVFLVGSDSKSQYAAAASAFHRSSGSSMPSLAIFEEKPNVARKNIKRVSRMVDEVAFGIDSDPRIEKFLAAK